MQAAHAAFEESSHGQSRQAAQGTQEAEAAEEARRLTRPAPRRAGVRRVGLISDTHGLLRPQAIAALRGSDAIIHAGDIGAAGILEALAGIAPVTAVRGNNDRAAWAAAIPDTNILVVDGVSLYVLHDLATLAVDPAVAGHRVVVFGHSHKPSSVERDGVLYVNPGSAGPRRFTLPVSLGVLEIEAGAVRARLIDLII